MAGRVRAEAVAKGVEEMEAMGSVGSARAGAVARGAAVQQSDLSIVITCC